MLSFFSSTEKKVSPESYCNVSSKTLMVPFVFLKQDMSCLGSSATWEPPQ